MTNETLQCYVCVTLAPALLMGHLVLIEMSTDSSQDTFSPKFGAALCYVSHLADVRKQDAAVSVTRSLVECSSSSLPSTALHSPSLSIKS